MPGAWKTVRVFISSTFRDMQAERDHLVRFVFPKLREELLKRRIHLVDVDLRWGVTGEQDASAVCREVIDECRPRFLCMLGGRYGWVPPGKNHSITADEVHHGVLDREVGQRGSAFFYFRDPAATATMVEEQPGEFREPSGCPNEGRLADLKQSIADHGLRPFVFPAQWDRAARRLTGLKAFGDRVCEDLRRSVDEEFGTQAPERLDEFAEENAAMEAFIEERTERFVLGRRESVWDELLQHAAGSGGNGCLCLVGEPGSGKSALLAKFFQHLSSAPSGNPQPAAVDSKLVIGHFVGASAGSTDGRRTLRRLCHELVKGTGLTAEIPDDPEKLRTAFPEMLKQACAKTRVVILLDAINQFDPGSSDLSWRPEELPPNARIIVSTLAGPALDDLRKRYLPPMEVPLPPLSPDDADAIISEFLHRYRKSVTPEQRAMLRAKTEAITPLYLLAALEELRTLGTYEEITDRIRELPETTQALFGWILKRLENDLGFRDAERRLVGHELVSHFAALLTASQHGLSHRELADLLAPGDAKANPPIEPDPHGNVAALLQLLRPYLMRRGELLDFYHGQFRSAAEQAYLQDDAQRHAAHTSLADYFHRLADPSNDRSWIGETARPFVELPFHLVRSDESKLHELVWNPHWYRAKLKHSDIYGLILDLAMIPQDRELRLVRDTVSLSAHAVARDDTQLASQLVGRLLACEEFCIQSLVEEITRTQTGLWLRPLVPILTPPGGPLLRTLEGHTEWIWAVVVTADGKVVSASGDHTLKVWDLASGRLIRTLRGHTRPVSAVTLAADGKVVSGSRDNTLKVWNPASGQVIRTLEGHTGEVSAVAVTGDGKIVSGSHDHTLKVWDLASGSLLRTLEGHADWILAVAVTGDGKVVSGSNDKTFKVWDLASGRLIRTLEGDKGTVLAVTGDGKVVSGPHDKTLKVWDLASGRLIRTLEGNFDLFNWPNAVAVTGEGKVVSGSNDKTLKVWNLASGRLIRTLEGHTEVVLAVAVTTDGKVVSGSRDKTLKVWDLASGEFMRTQEGHTGPVNAVAMTGDGKVVSGSNDKTLKVWDLASGQLLRTLKGHTSWVSAVAITGDGKMVSGSHDHTLKVWDLASGEFIRSLEGHTGKVSAVAVTGDGKVVSGADGMLKVWDLTSGQVIRTREEYYGFHEASSIHAVAVTTDGRVVSGSFRGSLKVWDLASGYDIPLWGTLAGHRGLVESVALTADGKGVSGSTDSSLKVWDLASGQLIRTLRGHTGSVYAVAVASDGKVLSASDDKTLKVWDLASGQLLASFAGEHAMRACAIAADRRTIVAGDEGGHVHFLRLEGL